MLTAASKHRKNAPCMINFPKKTSNGNLASCIPSGVRLSLLVRALTSLRASMARRMFLGSGGSSASRRVCSTSPSLQIFTRSTRSCRESRSISGVCCSKSYTLSVSTQPPVQVKTPYQLVMSVFTKQVETNAILNTPSATPTLFGIGTGNEGFYKSRQLSSFVKPAKRSAKIQIIKASKVLPHHLLFSCIDHRSNIRNSDTFYESAALSHHPESRCLTCFCNIGGNDNLPRAF